MGKLTPALFLRIAAVVTLLYGVGHSMGFPWTPAIGPDEASLIEQMKSLQFETEGVRRTYWDFYIGFGLIISAFLFLQAVVLWQLGALAKVSLMSVRPIIALFLIAFVVNAVLAGTYFFAIPLVMAIAISVCLAAALVAKDRK